MIVLQNESIVKYYLITIMEELELIYNTPNISALTLHRVKSIPRGVAEEAARKCIEMNSCKYFTFKQMLQKMEAEELPDAPPGTLPVHENIRGKDYYR